MPKEKSTINFRLDPKIIESLQAEATSRGSTISQVVREVLLKYVKEQGKVTHENTI